MPTFDSTAVRRAEYDAETRVLYLWFRDATEPYSYRDVPEEIFDALCDAESQGQYFHDHILDRFEFSPPA
jgi:hypothetical protein